MIELIEQFLQSAIDLVPELVNLIFITLIVPLVGRFAVWILSKWEDVKKSQPEILRPIMQEAAEIAVRFAEQKFKGKAVEGATKLKEAIGMYEEYMKELGYKNINTDAAEALIEKYVGELNKEK